MENVAVVDIHLPWGVVDECNGFSLDIGGSVIKSIYLHKDDWVALCERTKDCATLRCVSFPVSQFKEAMLYLKSVVFIQRNNSGEKPLIFTTGIGCSQHSKMIRETFDIRTMNITEHECFMAAFHYLVKHQRKGDILHKLDNDKISLGAASAKSSIRMFYNMFKTATKMDRMKITEACAVTFPIQLPCKPEDRFTDIFPCFVVCIGSRGGALYMREDGTYRYAQEMRRAGRSFMGIGSLLTNSQSYEEIMSKAEQGDMRTVHQYFGDLKEGIDKSEANYYSGFLECDMDFPAFLFGKTVFKDLGKFRSEDIARSFLFMTVSDMVQTIHVLMASHPEVKHVFFFGGFTSHYLAREFIVREWMERDTRAIAMYDQVGCANLHFLKHDAYLGALGAYLNPKLKLKAIEVIDEDI